MKPIYIDVLHIFVIIMMAGFVIFSVIGASGEYDHWTTRFVRHFRIRRRNRVSEEDPNRPPLN